MELKEKAALAAQVAATLLAAKIDGNTLQGPMAEKKAKDALALAYIMIADSCRYYSVK